MNDKNTVISNGGGARAGQYIIDGSCTWLVTDTRDGTPVGRVVADVCVRPGYVKANGATVNRADYPRLVAFADEFGLWIDETSKAAYPALFGKGDGETKMSLPDMRGVVGRYLDEGRGLDEANRVLGTYQGDLLKSHMHSYANPCGKRSNGYGVYYEKDNDCGVNATASTNVAGGVETRMKNISVLAVIRY